MPCQPVRKVAIARVLVTCAPWSFDYWLPVDNLSPFSSLSEFRISMKPDNEFLEKGLDEFLHEYNPVHYWLR